MALLQKPYAYSKVESEDPDETKHRKAQYLIYKAMTKADARRRPSWLRVKMFKLKVKIARRLKRLRKGLSSTFRFSAKPDFGRQIGCLLKSCKHLVYGKPEEPVVRSLPSI